MQGTSCLESRWIQIPSEKELNPTNSYYYNYQYVDNGNRTAADHCNYVGQSQPALYHTGSAYPGQYSLRSGSVANESPWNAPAQIGQAEPVHLSLDSPSTQKSYQMNGGTVVPLESSDQSVRSVHCVALMGQTVKDWSKPQNGTLVPTRQNPQGLEITQEKWPCFSSLATCNVPQRHMNNCFNGTNFQRMMDSGQVTTANSSFAQLPHPVEWNSTHRYMQLQSPMAGGMVNNRYVTLSKWQRRSNSPKAVASVRQVTAPNTRMGKTNVRQGTKSSEQGTIGSQKTGDGSRGGVNRMLCQNQSVAPPPTMCMNSHFESAGVSSSQNMANTNYSAVPSAGGFNCFLPRLLQTNPSPDGISSRNRSTVRGSCSETNQRSSAAVEVPLLSSGPGLSASKGNGSNSPSPSCTSHGYSQTYIGQLPRNILTKANGSVMTCDSGFIQQQRDFVGMSCPQPAVQQQTLQPLKGSGMAGSSLCQPNAGSLAIVCHTNGHPSASTDENSNTGHPRAVTCSSGQRSHTDQLLQFLSQPNSGKCQGYFVTATDDRKGNGLTADNVIRDRQPVCSLKTQESTEMVTEQSAKEDHDKISRELDRTNNSENPNTQLLVSETSAKMDVFKLPKANGQQSMPVGTGVQKAVAVVPPISQQSNVMDQTDCAASAEGCLPCKIQNAWSLTGYSEGNKPDDEGSNLCLSQNGMDKVTSGSFSDEMACRGKPLHNSLSEIPAEVVCSPSNQQHSKSTNQGTLKMGSRNEMSCSEFIHSESEGTPQNTHNNMDDLENVFCLSTMPVSEWTADNLRKLIADLEVVATPTEYNKQVVSQIIDLFWGGDQKNVMNALYVGLYRTIFDYWEVSIEEDNPAVLTHFDNTCIKKMAEKCQILAHGATFPNETVYKSSWLNLNEKLDDIDMEHGFPMSLRFDVKMPGRGNRSSELNAIEKRKVIEPVKKTVDMDVQQTVLQVPAIELPDPLSSIEIKVLLPEDAKKYFGSIASENGLTGETQNKESEQDSEKKDYQNDVYCCILRWIEVLNGQEENSTCRCQSQGSQEMETTSDESLKQKLEVTVESPLELSNGDPVVTTEQKNKGLCARKDIKTMTEECSVGTEAVQQSDDTKSISELQIVSPAGKSGLNAIEIKVEDVYSGHMEVVEVEASPSFQTGSTIPEISEELHNPGCMNVNNCLNNGDAKKMGTDTTDRKKFSNISDPQKSVGGFEPVSLRQRFHHRLCRKKRPKHRNDIRWKEGECKEEQKRTLHSNPPVQNLLHRTEKEGEKLSACPQSVPGIKTQHNCNNHSIVKVRHKHKLKNGESQVLSDVPKRSVSSCGKHKQAAKGKVEKKLKKEISHKSTAATESSTTVSLTLYGSSPQPDHKINLFRPDKPIPPPKISLNISPHNKNISEKDLVKNNQAKQRVYSSWKSSWIPQKVPSKTKVLHSTKNGKEKACTHKKHNKETNSPNVPPSQTDNGSSLKLNLLPSHSNLLGEAIDKREKDANKSHSNPSKPILKTEDTVPVRKDRAVLSRDKQTQLCSMKEKPQLPLRAIKRKRSENGQNARVSKRFRLQQSRRCNSVERSKYEIGNPALMPFPVKANILEFKLLPESFDFREAEDYEMEKKPLRQSKKTSKPQELEESTRKKMTTWKIKGPWSHNLRKKEPVSDSCSSRMTMPSHTAYEEYRRRYLDKARK